MKIRLNADLGGFKKGMILEGSQIDSAYWRARIKDSEIDNCLEVVLENQEVEPKKIKKSKEVNNDNINARS